MGVGIRFDNYPTNVDRFYTILSLEGCHKDAASRVLKRINKRGYDLLTVMDGLHFDWIKEELEKIGVRMSYIDAQPNWKQIHQNGKWDKEDIVMSLEHNKKFNTKLN